MTTTPGSSVTSKLGFEFDGRIAVRYGRRVLERCAGLLSQAAELLSADLTAADRLQGWTDPKRTQLLRIVDEWKAEILAATTIKEVKEKVIGRWFLENWVEYGAISDLLAQTDNAITDYKEGLGGPEGPDGCPAS